jgi:hypothetical protein
MMLSSPPQAVVQGSASHVGTAGTLGSDLDGYPPGVIGFNRQLQQFPLGGSNSQQFSTLITSFHRNRRHYSEDD